LHPPCKEARAPQTVCYKTSQQRERAEGAWMARLCVAVAAWRALLALAQRLACERETGATGFGWAAFSSVGSRWSTGKWDCHWTAFEPK